MTGHGTQAEGRETPRASRLAWWPRPETVLLLLSLAWTAGAKLRAVHQQVADAPILSWLQVTVDDLAFFAGIALAMTVASLAAPRCIAARVNLVLAAVVLAWAVLNSAWILATGVQLTPGILGVLLEDPEHILPMVTTHLKGKPLFAVVVGVTGLACLAWLVWRLVRVRSMTVTRHALIRRAAATAVALVALVAVSTLGRGDLGYVGEMLSFNSHWYALTRSVSDPMHDRDVASASRELPRIGERGLTPPANGARPNIVIVFLESVSHASVENAATPVLDRLFEEGVRFERTYVPSPVTSKAFWAALTGSTPDMRQDYAESVIVDRPFEGLPTILAEAGYRTGFFELSRGTFECAPGLFANLDFDWAYFRENHPDPDIDVGYLSADDFEVIEPAFDWVEDGDGPFLLTLMTTVAHDPYVVPDWFAAPAESRHERYRQAVEYTDAFVGRVCETLAERGLAGDTIVCVIGDHGEGFRAESRRGRWVPFEEVVRVPWVITWPGHLEPGTRIDGTCSQLDVTPTLLAMLGYDPGDAGFDGRDAMQPIAEDRRLYFGVWDELGPVGFVQGDVKYVYYPYTGGGFVYDLAADPGELAPERLDGDMLDRIAADATTWRQSTTISVPPRRFRERTVFRHWRTVSSGRSSWAFFVPADEDTGR